MRSTLFVAAAAIISSAMASAAEPTKLAVVELARGVAPQQPQQPQIAIDAKGAIHVVYGTGDRILYRRSDDGGKTFAAPIDLPEVHAMSLGMRRGPRIAAAGSTLCVTAIGGKQGKGRDGDLMSVRSTDGGKHWTSPIVVNDAPDSAREGLHAMAASAQGSLCCVWLDLRNQRTEVMASISTDGGESWGKNVLVYQSPERSVCECCHPSVTLDSSGKIHVLWRNSLSGARDMYVASSADGGKTFSQATKLGTGTWPLKGCPMDGGGIATTAPGQLVTAWRREKTVFLSVPGQNSERRLGDGEQPWIAATAAGPYVVWLKKRGESAWLLKPDIPEPIELAAHAADPVIATGSSPGGPVVAAWEAYDGNQRTIQCQVIAQ